MSSERIGWGEAGVPFSARPVGLVCVAFLVYLGVELLGGGPFGLPAVSAFPPKHAAGARIADGGLLYRDHVQYDGMVYHYPPVFLYTLGGVYALVGAEPTVGYAVLAAALAVSVGLVFRLARTIHDRRTAWIAAGVFAANPITLVIAYGNYFDPFVVAFTLLAFERLVRGHPTSAGVALALGATSKPFPVVFLPVAVVYCYRNATSLGRFLAGVAGVVGVVSVPFLLAAPAAYLRYAVLFSFERPAASLSLIYYFLPWLDTTPLTAVLPAGVVLGGSLWLDRLGLERATVVHGAAGLMLGFLLVNRIDYPHYLVYVVPFAAIVLARALTARWQSWGTSVARLLTVGTLGVVGGAVVWSLPWLDGVERIDTAEFAFKSDPLFWVGAAIFFVAGFATLAVLARAVQCVSREAESSTACEPNG